MAKTDLNTLKNWFKTGLKPTQTHFWNWLDSFRHKDDAVPVSDVDGLEDTLAAKANNSELAPVAKTGDYEDLENKPANLSNFNDDIGAKELEIVKVTDKSQIINQVLDANKEYRILKSITLGDGEFINMESSPLISGLGADFTSISTNSSTGVIFKCNACQNVNIKNLSLSSLVAGSKVFELKDEDADFENDEVGTHEFRLKGVNFVACKDLGFVDGFRQWFSIDLGMYGVEDGIEMRGVWNGMFFDQANMFGIGSSATFFKQGANLSFVDRCIFQANFSVPTGAVFMDFQPSVFQDIEALQINNTVAKVDGVKDQNNAMSLFPNINANDPKSLWGINTGLPSTASELIIIDEDVSGTYVIDWLNDTYDLVLTGDTVFSEINLPASGRRTKTLNITISGDFVPTFPVNWENNRVGTFKGTDLNSIDIKFISTGKYSMKISNSLSVYPAPILGSVSPVSLLPNSTSELVLSGSFFTPQGFVLIDGQEVNSIEFDADTGDYILSVTTGAMEDEFDITISNGITITFSGKLIVNLGEVFVPTENDWINLSGSIDVSDSGSAKLGVYNTLASATWDKTLDYTVDFSLRFNFKESSLGGYSPNSAAGEFNKTVEIVKSSDGTAIMSLYFASNNVGIYMYAKDLVANQTFSNLYSSNGGLTYQENLDLFATKNLEIRVIGGLFYVYIDNSIKASLSTALTENVKMKVGLKKSDLSNIKQIVYP